MGIALGMSILLWAGAASANICGTPGAAEPPDCIDCGPAGDLCEVTKYGLGGPLNYTRVTDPLDDLLYTHGDFDGSYAYNKATGDPEDPSCDGEGEFIAQFGQFLLREREGCVPTAANATCANDPEPKRTCPNVEASSPECDGGPCTAPSACQVEFAVDVAGDYPGALSSPNLSFFSGSRLIYSPIDLGGGFIVTLWLSVASNGSFIGRGTRYDLPSTPDPDDTRVHWDRIAADTRAANTSRLCCNTDAPFDFCAAISEGRWLPYPEINPLGDDSPTGSDWPDWLFEGGAATPFTTDTSFVQPNQRHGVCSGDRDWGCTGDGGSLCTITPAPPATPFTGPCGCGSCVCNQDRCDENTNTCRNNPGTACNGDAFCCTNPACGPILNKCADNPAQACTADWECRDAPCRGFAVSGSTCQLEEMGWRLQVQSLDGEGKPNPNMCGGGMYVFKGTPAQYCGLLDQYEVDGDPGPSCAVQNYAVSVRPDATCDGIDDVIPDKCPYYSEIDPFADTTPSGQTPDGRGDECQCADTAADPGGGLGAGANSSGLTVRPDGTIAGYGNGMVNVGDLISTNILLFTYPSDADWDIFAPRCDGNDEGGVNACNLATQRCYRDLAAPACTTNDDCISPLTCNPGTGKCNNCTADAHCASGSCNTYTGLCRTDSTIQCVQSEDCRTGSICTVSDLVATNGEVFSPGATALCPRVRPAVP
jgi:hypothetical protein